MIVDVGDPRHVAQPVHALGQQAGRHLLEHGVLRAARAARCPTSGPAGRTTKPAHAQNYGRWAPDGCGADACRAGALPSGRRATERGRHVTTDPRRPTATWRWSSSASPRRPRWRPSRWMGRGDKNGADGAAVNAMRVVLASCRWTASSSSARARRTRPRCSSTASGSATARRRRSTSRSTRSTGTTLAASAAAGALAVIALSERGTMFDPGPCVYMEKIAVGPRGPRLDRPQRRARPRTSTRSPTRSSSRCAT